MPAGQLKPEQAICLLSLSGEAYTAEALEAVRDWQAESNTQLLFVILDAPERVNLEVLGLEVRTEAYFRDAIRRVSWNGSVEVISFSDAAGRYEEIGRLQMQISERVRSSRILRDRLRAQSFRSLHFQLHEVSVRNQRHGIVDHLINYLIMELALLGALAEHGFQVELAFHRRDPLDEVLGGEIRLPVQVLLRGVNRNPGVRLEDVTVGIPGTGRVVGPITFQVPTGQILGILGPNGSGKTTLLRAIAGHVPVASGLIEVAGRDVTALAPFRRDVTTMFQDIGLIDSMTAGGNIKLGTSAAIRRKSSRATSVYAEGASQLRMDSALETRAGKLSGGQRQLVALLRAFSSAPSCLLLDEPTASLDRVRQERFVSALKHEIKNQQISVIAVSHDIQFISSVSNQLIILDAQGSVVEGGPIESFSSGARTFVGAEALGARNLFEIVRGPNHLTLGDWTIGEDERFEPPPDARGVSIPPDAISCHSRSQGDKGKQTPGQLVMKGVITSRRLLDDGDYILFQPDSGEANKAYRGMARGLWLARGSTSLLSAMRVSLRVNLSAVRWLR